MYLHNMSTRRRETQLNPQPTVTRTPSPWALVFLKRIQSMWKVIFRNIHVHQSILYWLVIIIVRPQVLLDQVVGLRWKPACIKVEWRVLLIFHTKMDGV